MGSLLYHFAQAIFTIVLMAAGGIMLAKCEILDGNSLQILSKPIFYLLLPCICQSRSRNPRSRN